MAIARVWTSIYCAVFSIPAGSTDTSSLVALALNSITARVTVTRVTQDSAPSLVTHTSLVVAVSIYTAQTTHFLLTILALEESITDALAHVPVKLPMPGAVAGTEMSQVKFVG